MATAKPFKFPMKMGLCADKLYDLRARRLDAQKVADLLEAEEKALKLHIINNLPKSESSGVSGKTANVKIQKKEIPQVNDWEKFYGYVKKNNAWDLMQKRLSEGAVNERLDAGKKIPGVEIFNAVTVSCTKI